MLILGCIYHIKIECTINGEKGNEGGGKIDLPTIEFSAVEHSIVNYVVQQVSGSYSC